LSVPVLGLALLAGALVEVLVGALLGELLLVLVAAGAVWFPPPTDPLAASCCTA